MHDWPELPQTSEDGQRWQGISPFEFERTGVPLTKQTPKWRARQATHRAHARWQLNAPRPPSDPWVRWLTQVEDECFKAGCQWGEMEIILRRPWWRLWEFIQIKAIRYVPHSRFRAFVEPDPARDEWEVGYRDLWVIRSRSYWWDVLVRFFWLYARDSAIRRWIAPDIPKQG